MRVGVVDLGSNTSLLLVADVADDGRVIARRDEATVTKMGQGVFATGRFHVDALGRVDAALARYQRIIAEHACEMAFAVATSAARDVTNADELRALGRTHAIPVHVVDGAREAALTYVGATGGLTLAGEPAVIDVGGGSTELIAPSPGGRRTLSVNVGAVRATERFVTVDPPAVDELNAIRSGAAEAFAAANVPPAPGEVVAVAGTPTTLATLDQGRAFEVERVHGYRLTHERVVHWAERLGAMPLAARRALPGMPPDRADVMPAGVIILEAAMSALGARSIVVSTRGVRYGAAARWRQFVP